MLRAETMPEEKMFCRTMAKVSKKNRRFEIKFRKFKHVHSKYGLGCARMRRRT